MVRPSLRQLVQSVYEPFATTKKPKVDLGAKERTVKKFHGDILFSFAATPLAELKPSEQTCSLCQKPYEAEDKPRLVIVEEDATALDDAATTPDNAAAAHDDDAAALDGNAASLNTKEERSTTSSEKPIRLTCGHIFGLDCIIKLVAPDYAQGKETNCPICQQLIRFRHIEHYRDDWFNSWGSTGNVFTRHRAYQLKEWVEGLRVGDSFDTKEVWERYQLGLPCEQEML